MRGREGKGRQMATGEMQKDHTLAVFSSSKGTKGDREIGKGEKRGQEKGKGGRGLATRENTGAERERLKDRTRPAHRPLF